MKFHQIETIETTIKGRKVMREILLLKSAVGALVLDSNERIGLVKQYRPALDRTIWEIPAGVLDKPHLTPLETLLEELEEECEITSAEILRVNSDALTIYPMIAGSSAATMQIFEIRVTEQSNKQVADADVEEVAWVDFSDFEKMVAKGEIYDAKSLMAYHLWKDLRMKEDKAFQQQGLTEQVERIAKSTTKELKKLFLEADEKYLQICEEYAHAKNSLTEHEYRLIERKRAKQKDLRNRLALALAKKLDDAKEVSVCD